MNGLFKRAALCAAAVLLGLVWAPKPSSAASFDCNPTCFVGGEDSDGQSIGTVTTSTSSSFYRSGYARLALGMTFGTVTDPPANRFVTPTFPAQGTIYVHAESYQASLANTSLNMNPLSIYGSDGVPRLMIRGTGTAGQVKLAKETTAGSYTDLATCTSGVWPAVSLHKIDLYAHVAVSGEFRLKVDGTTACDFVGDTTTDGVTTVNQVSFAGTNISGATDYWSEMVVSTLDTSNYLGIVTYAPTGNGSPQNWVGNYLNVNGTNYNDTNALTTGTSNQVADFVSATSLPSGSYTIVGFCQNGRIQKGASGPSDAAWQIKAATAGSDSSSSAIGITTSFANYSHCWYDNPATTVGWTQADLASGLQYGAQSQP